MCLIVQKNNINTQTTYKMCTKLDVVALMQCCKPKICCPYKDGKLTLILSISPSHFESSLHSIFLSSLSIPTPLSLPLPEIT